MKEVFDRAKAVEILRTKTNVRITHQLFDKNEYLYMKNGVVYTEEGYVFEDWQTFAHNGMRMRSGPEWEYGWSYYEDDSAPQPHNRYRKIEYVEEIGDYQRPMVALYDSQYVTEEQARYYLACGQENLHIMLIRKEHYDNILVPAVNEAKMNAIK